MTTQTKYTYGTMNYWQNHEDTKPVGVLHREDGPAITYENGDPIAFVLNNQTYDFDDWIKELKRMGYDDDHLVEMIVRYG